VGIAQEAGVDVVGVDVLSKADCLCQFVLPLPDRSLGPVIAAQGDRTAWELIVLEVEVV
jgi:hypothetical protein